MRKVSMVMAVVVAFSAFVFAKSKPHVLESERPQIETWKFRYEYGYRLQSESKDIAKSIVNPLVFMGTIGMAGNDLFNGTVVTHRFYENPKTKQSALVIIFGGNEEQAIYVWKVESGHWHVALKDIARDEWQIGEAFQLLLKLRVDDKTRSVLGVDVHLGDGMSGPVFIPFRSPIHVPTSKQFPPHLYLGRYSLSADHTDTLTDYRDYCRSINSTNEWIRFETRSRCDLWR